MHLCIDLPPTFGGVAHVLLKKIVVSSGNAVHFVSDQYVIPTIKGEERKSRAGVSTQCTYAITGPKQKRPINWQEALKNWHFKDSMIKFLVDYWQSDEFETIIGNKLLFINYGNICYGFSVIQGKVVRRIVHELCNYHEEADSRMVFHIIHLPRPNNVVVTTQDTDIMVILLGCMDELGQGLKISLDLGINSNNSRRFLSINQLANNLGSNICQSLPEFHALTGSDYTAAFGRKGKIRPFKNLSANPAAQNALKVLGQSESIEEKTFQEIEKFVCQLYGKNDLDSLDDVRLEVFLKRYTPKKWPAVFCNKKS